MNKEMSKIIIICTLSYLLGMLDMATGIYEIIPYWSFLVVCVLVGGVIGALGNE